MGVEELSVGVVFFQRTLLPTLFPIGSTLLDGLRKAGMTAIANIQFLRGQITAFFQVIEKHN